jgi:hypothetical protein
MFARSSPRAYICLQCRSHLLRRRANAPLVASLQRSPFSAVHSRASQPDDNDASPKKLPLHSNRDIEKEDEDHSNVRLVARTFRKSAEEPPNYPFGKKPRGKGSWYVLGKVRGPSGGETREGSTALSIDSLGAPTEIILLKDLALDQAEKEEENEADESPADKQDSTRDAIIKSIEGEKIQLDQQTINVQIDRLRPARSGSGYAPYIVSAAAYANLRRKLERSYTSNHLREYCRMKGIKIREQEEQSVLDKKIALTWSPWRAGITPIGQRPASEKRISQIRNWDAVGKQALYKAIIESIWNVHTTAERDSELGELEVRLKPWEIALFTSGSKIDIP